ncbi:hypothetical protein [Streptomyces sp. NPDC014676]
MAAETGARVYLCGTGDMTCLDQALVAGTTEPTTFDLQPATL